MGSLYFSIVLIITTSLFATTKANNTKLQFSSNDLWNNFGEFVTIIYEKCNSNSKFSLLSKDFKNCFKHTSLPLINSIFERDVITITSGFALLKQTNTTSLEENQNLRTKRNIAWSDIKKRIGNVFDTHLLRMDLEPSAVESKGRRRKHNQMMAVLLFGVLATGMMLIPMGFHFLAILGGKALLLAKMALMLSSIQGLKKIATSNINYGLYHTNPWRSDHAWRDDKEGAGTNIVTAYQQPPNMYKPE